MWRFTLAQMRTSVGKLVLAGVAIVLGTAFITATLLASTVVRVSTEAVMTASLAGADVIAEGVSPTNEQVSQIRALPGVAAVDHQRRQGLPVSSAARSYYLHLQTLPTVGTKPTVLEGRLPTSLGEVALSKDVASSLQVTVGDTLQWQSWRDEIRASVTLSGITEPGLALLQDSPGWTMRETVDDLRARMGVQPDDVSDVLLIYADGTVPAATIARHIHRALPVFEPETAQMIIDQKVKDMVGNANFFIYFGLAFAAVAVGVAGMVIANTFEVLVAQRTHTLALLRCGGATKSQVRRTVLLEAVVLGVVASVSGILVGLGVGYLGVWWVSKQSLGIVTPSMLEVPATTLLIPLAVGVLVTLVSALGPARSATRVSPVAALRPTAVGPVRRGSRLRLIVGGLLSLLGLVLLLTPPVLVLRMRGTDSFNAISDRLGPLLLSGVSGGLLTVAGFLVLSVFVVPPIVRILGAGLALLVPRRARATVRLATANAVRNPRRIAATTSALVIGVGLVTMMATGAATGRATVARSIQQFFPADALVGLSAESGTGLNPELISAIEGTQGVEAAFPFWLAQLEYQGEWTTVPVYDPEAPHAVLGLPASPGLKPGHVGVRPDAFRQGVPSEVTIRRSTDSASPSVTLPTQEIKGLMGETVVAPDSLQTLALGQPKGMALNINDEDAAGTVQRLQDVVATASGDTPAEVTAPILERLEINQILDALVAVLLALLSVAVVIALVGVANTLTLSVIERRREQGMLRSVGVTARQLRGMLATEGALIALGGVVIGTALGLLTGLAGMTIMLGSNPSFTFALDWRVLAGSLVVGLLAGLIASVAPARAALKVPVVVALAND